LGGTSQQKRRILPAEEFIFTHWGTLKAIGGGRTHQKRREIAHFGCRCWDIGHWEKKWAGAALGSLRKRKIKRGCGYQKSGKEMGGVEREKKERVEDHKRNLSKAGKERVGCERETVEEHFHHWRMSGGNYLSNERGRFMEGGSFRANSSEKKRKGGKKTRGLIQRYLRVRRWEAVNQCRTPWKKLC